LLPRLVELAGRGKGAVQRIAAVADVRSGEFFDALQGALQVVEQQGVSPRVVYLEADDESIVRRFEASRRPHPLQADGRLVDGIAREREQLAELRDRADLLIDTSDLNVHQLRRRIDEAFKEVDTEGVQVTVMSFGYKYGLPVDADLVVDCRFLPNPHWIPDLRPLTGRDAAVSEFVLGQPATEPFLAAYIPALRIVLQGYAEENKRYATLAIGCTGGKHRSVAISEEIARRIANPELAVSVVHRDLGRE
ncbi:MAG: RNase adapter RapZ, partial [Candidatus Nanopelagicales bacterium]